MTGPNDNTEHIEIHDEYVTVNGTDYYSQESYQKDNPTVDSATIDFAFDLIKSNPTD